MASRPISDALSPAMRRGLIGRKVTPATVRGLVARRLVCPGSTVARLGYTPLGRQVSAMLLDLYRMQVALYEIEALLGARVDMGGAITRARVHAQQALARTRLWAPMDGS